jgi:hypothetical protein
MSDFGEKVVQEQMTWRRNFLPEVERNGTWKGQTYPHILPCEQWEKNLWPGIRSESEHSLTRHLTTTETAIQKLICCPAAMGGYQLLRQQALAEGIATSGEFDLVVSCVAYDERNEPLIRSLQRIGVNNFLDGWSGLFKGKARFRTFTHQQWAAWVRRHDTSGHWRDWSDYVWNRYGY